MIRFSLIALSVLLSAQAQAAMRSYEASAQSSHWTLVENSRLQCHLIMKFPIMAKPYSALMLAKIKP